MVAAPGGIRFTTEPWKKLLLMFWVKRPRGFRVAFGFSVFCVFCSPILLVFLACPLEEHKCGSLLENPAITKETKTEIKGQSQAGPPGSTSERTWSIGEFSQRSTGFCVLWHMGLY